MSTGCEFYRDGLVALAAGSLDRERQAVVEAHLASCEECRAELSVIRTLRAAAPAVPPGLESRIVAAVRGAAEAGEADPSAAPAPTRSPAETPTGAARLPGAGRAGRRMGAGRWRPVALPLAAAAAVALVWIGVGLPGGGGGDGDPEASSVEELEPYGALPAGDGVVAGDLLLSELTVEDLERLLEEMQ